MTQMMKKISLFAAAGGGPIALSKAIDPSSVAGTTEVETLSNGDSKAGSLRGSAPEGRNDEGEKTVSALELSRGLLPQNEGFFDFSFQPRSGPRIEGLYANNPRFGGLDVNLHVCARVRSVEGCVCKPAAGGFLMARCVSSDPNGACVGEFVAEGLTCPESARTKL